MLSKVIFCNGVVAYRSDLLTAIGVSHAFSTRMGGVSTGPFDSLNLGNPNGCPVQDDETNIQQNYDRMHAAVGCADRPRCWTHQVHGRDVVTVMAGDSFSCGTKADALVTNDRGRLLAVRVADCVPVLFATTDGRFVGAAHAGWRGVVLNVVTETLTRLLSLTNNQKPVDVVAAVGPSIGPESFEVGPDVVKEFSHTFPADVQLIKPLAGDKSTIDLRSAIALQLTRAGVPVRQIDTTDRDTFRDADEFFSHRRERGVTGRMAAVIASR